MTKKPKNGKMMRFVAVDPVTGRQLRNVAGDVVAVNAFTRKAAKHALKGMTDAALTVEERS